MRSQFGKPKLRLVALAFACLLGTTLPASAKDRTERERRAEIKARIERLEAIKAVERLQSAYGYYQDRFFFQEVADLFSSESPRVQWGDNVWEGREAVSHFWTSYMRGNLARGTDGPRAGQLFDLPQWQGVITIDGDGKGARARFRTLGRLANYREAEYWISGVYENEYVLEDGVWKFKSLKFCPSWSAIYTEGWQNSRSETALAWIEPPRDQFAAAVQGANACPEGYPSGKTLPFHFEPSGPYAIASAFGTGE